MHAQGFATTSSAEGADSSRLFWLAWLACTLAALAPLWAFRFPPLQDYPQHLFHALVLATYDSPDFDWPLHYTASLSPGPYSLFYALTAPLVTWLGVGAAGRLVLAAYVLLLSSYVAVEARERRSAPWPLLLLIPLAFNQAYYMGFTNYFLALPALLFALRGHARLLEGGRRNRGLWLSQGVWLLLLFMAHLSLVLVYIGLALLRVLRRWRGGRPAGAALPPLLVGALLVTWLLCAPTTNELSEVASWRVRWWPLSETLSYLGLAFTGMRSEGGVRSAAVLAWLLVSVAFGASLWRRPSPGGLWTPRRIDELSDLGATLLAYLALPFWLAHYSYVNLRLAPVVYLLATVALASVPIAPRLRPVLVAGVLMLCATHGSVHAEGEAETAELLPLLAAMEPNRNVFPIYVDASSRALDRRYFYQLHAHAHFYYHVLRGGGMSTGLFPTALVPVQQRERTPEKPAGDPDTARLLTSLYPYVLVRGSDPQLDQALRDAYRASTRSGAWSLYADPRPEGL